MPFRLFFNGINMEKRSHLIRRLFIHESDFTEENIKQDYERMLMEKYKHRILKDLRPFMDLFIYSNHLYRKLCKIEDIDEDDIFKEAVVYVVYMLYEDKYNVFGNRRILK